MNLVTVLPLVIAGMALAAGGYHLLIGLRLGRRREHLSFAALCVAIAVYDILCARLYSAATSAEGGVWQRWQVVALGLGSVALVEFISDYTGRIPKAVRRAMAGAYLSVVVVALVAPVPWVFGHAPAVKHVVMPLTGISATYHEVETGPVFDALGVLGISLFVVVAAAGWALYRAGDRERARPLLVALVLFFLGVVNDAAVGAGLLKSVYVIEYSFLAMVGLMAYTLSNTMLRGATAEQAVRQSQERFRALVETTSDLVWEVDAEGTYTYVSPRVRDILGMQPEEVIGRTPFDLMPPEEGNRIETFFREISADARPFTMLENVNLHRDGRRVVLESSGIPVLEESGRLLGYRGIDRDITAHQQAFEALRESEDQLRQAQKMEAVGRLAGGVAHDFNNLLQAIHSHADAMRAALDDPRRVAEGLAELIEQARRGARMTRQLLVFSRRDGARFDVVDLVDVVRGGCRLVRRLLREDLELELEAPEGSLPVEGDRGQLEQVLMNLALNAADAMPRGGRIAVRLRRDRGLACMAVVDAGSGIEAELRDRVFEPFFTTKGPGQGSGLGLSVVHGIVSSHGGTVELKESGPGGSTFEVSLPLARAVTAAGLSRRAEAAVEPSAPTAGRVLLVEDDPGTRAALVGLLESIGWSVVEAESVAEASSCSWGEGFDLLLSDFLLPDGRGHHLAEMVRQRWPGLAVILMTGYADSPEIDDIVHAAEVGFLRKPFGLAALIEEIERIRARSGTGGL